MNDISLALLPLLLSPKTIAMTFVVYILGVFASFVVWCFWWVYYSPRHSRYDNLTSLIIVLWPVTICEISVSYILNVFYKAREKRLDKRKG